jgi:putative acetyltransferase
MLTNEEIYIRAEETADLPAIYQVNEAAFGRPDEANLVDALRQNDGIVASLVAVYRQKIVGHILVGHILFSPMTLDESIEQPVRLVALGPMAVYPDYQGLGIGSQLVRAGIEQCRQVGYELMIVLGHPWFYPRFGFAPAAPHGIRAQWDVADEVFMVKELQNGALAEVKGVVRYRPEFGS